MRSPLALAVCLAAGVAGMAGPAAAVDGTLEINQACARQTGCFPGDDPGFPVTITAAGSYRLTSNLGLSLQVNSSQEVQFIEISAENVHIDLGGFTIQCRRLLLGSRCSSSSSVHGIEASVGRTTLRNGSITGMASYGVFLREDSRVEDLRATDNGSIGIWAGSGSIVRGSIASENGSHGFAGGAGTWEGCTARKNISEGFRIDGGSVLRGNVAWDNGSNGFHVGPGSTLTDNTSSKNGGHGFSLHPPSGGTSLTGGIAIGNSAMDNDGLGINAGVRWGYVNNILTFNNDGNDSPQTNGAGLELGQNVCGENLTCP